MPAPTQLHLYATDVFMAGPGWTGAYGAALRHLAAPDVAGLRSPTVFMCREDDVLYGYLDRLPVPLPADCTIERVRPDTLAWRERLLAVLARANLPPNGFTPPDSFGSEAVIGEREGYVAADGAQVRVRCFGRDSAIPLLMLHEPPGGSVQLRDLALELGRDRLVVVPDLPGNGESSPLPDPSAANFAATLASVMRTLGLAPFDVFAEPLASSLAVQLAVQEPDRTRKLVLDSVTRLTARQRTGLKREYAPAVAPRGDGTHLHAMWHMLRDLELNWPWYSRDIESIRVRDPDLSASRLNGRLVEVMKQLEHYGDAALAALDCPVAALLPQVRQPALLLNDETDVRYRDTRRAARLMKNASMAPAGGGNAAIASAIRSFLDA